MTMDTTGLDVALVGLPVTGYLGFAPKEAIFDRPTPATGGQLDYVVPSQFIRPGLLTEDGGPEWTLEADGDPITFWQDGYSIPSGAANVSLKVTFAQTSRVVMEIIRGKQFDANGYMTVDGGGSSAQWELWLAEIFKNGAVRRRWAPNSNVKSVAEVKSERGEVLGYETEFAINRDALVEMNHFGEWLILPGGVVPGAPTITAATPAGAEAGDTVTLTGTGFTGATAVRFGAANATSFAVVSASEITAVVPAGTAGSAQITVAHANGNATFPYTRG